MNVAGCAQRTIWQKQGEVFIIDQTQLPFAFNIVTLKNLNDAARAIADMQVRGAPLIGVTAAYAVALAMAEDASDAALKHATQTLRATRPTAVNLAWALDVMSQTLQVLPEQQRATEALKRAEALANEDVQTCKTIGEYGLPLLRRAWEKAGSKRRLNILTHCNAGWLATVDWGTALSPVYHAHAQGIPVHVWVDETRPRNQGARLTAWELGQQGVPHTVIVDNLGGHLMQSGQVDLCIVGSDRTAHNGDVCNKIGTYLKALAAHDNNIPFYVALPLSTIDRQVPTGADIPIEQRCESEVTQMSDGTNAIRMVPHDSPAINFGFDVTPARLVTALITEKGVGKASHDGIDGFYI